MTVNEIGKILKNIPEEIYEIPLYDKLFSNVTVHKLSSELSVRVSANILVISVQVFDDMDFTLRIYNMDEVSGFLKILIKDVADRIASYLSILGFSCINEYENK